MGSGHLFHCGILAQQLPAQMVLQLQKGPAVPIVQIGDRHPGPLGEDLPDVAGLHRAPLLAGLPGRRE